MYDWRELLGKGDTSCLFNIMWSSGRRKTTQRRKCIVRICHILAKYKTLDKYFQVLWHTNYHKPVKTRRSLLVQRKYRTEKPAAWVVCMIYNTPHVTVITLEKHQDHSFKNPRISRRQPASDLTKIKNKPRPSTFNEIHQYSGSRAELAH